MKRLVVLLLVLTGAVAAPARADTVVAHTYRLALINDPSYARYFDPDGTHPERVQAAKQALVNRVNQVYGNSFGIHLVLVDPRGDTNLATPALWSGANGPCGTTACFPDADTTVVNDDGTPALDDKGAAVHGCTSTVNDDSKLVAGLLIGAENFDVAQVIGGADLAGAGGVSTGGAVGLADKAEGCSGFQVPVGDGMALGFLAHEIGHQFGANHTFNSLACDSQRDAGASVEPGSGSSIMSYTGICNTDDLQSDADPYFSEQTESEVDGFVGSGQPAVHDQQVESFAAGEGRPYTLKGPDGTTATVTAAGRDAAQAAADAVLGKGAADVRRRDLEKSTLFDDTGFSVTYADDADHAPLQIAIGSGDFHPLATVIQGGPARNGGDAAATANHAPVVTTAPALTVPARTPFTLTGSATDADGNPLTYLWEQNDPGAAAAGALLISNLKTTGPLFRLFGTAKAPSAADEMRSPAPNTNVATAADRVRTFPDPAQIAADHTDAKTGACPAVNGVGPTVDFEIAQTTVDCYSEFLPTATWRNLAGTPVMHFRLTAMDNVATGGGVGHADTTVTVAGAAGPFRVTSSAKTIAQGGKLPVRWSVAGTAAVPVAAKSVAIALSLDGGLTFPRTLLAKTANDGKATVKIPKVKTAKARIRVAAVGNVFFDISHANTKVVPRVKVKVGAVHRSGKTAKVAVRCSAACHGTATLGHGHKAFSFKRSGTVKVRGTGSRVTVTVVNPGAKPSVATKRL